MDQPNLSPDCSGRENGLLQPRPCMGGENNQWEPGRADTVPLMFLCLLIGFSPLSLMEVELPWRDRKTTLKACWLCSAHGKHDHPHNTRLKSWVLLRTRDRGDCWGHVRVHLNPEVCPAEAAVGGKESPGSPMNHTIILFIKAYLHALQCWDQVSLKIVR